MNWFDNLIDKAGNVAGKAIDGYTQLELAKVGGGVAPLPTDNGSQNTYRPETIPDQGATNVSAPSGPSYQVGERIVFAGIEFDKNILTATALVVGAIYVSKKVL